MGKKSKAEYPGFRKNLSEYFADYSQQTAIHGVKYVGNKALGSLERLWWVVTLCVSIILCSILIRRTYQKWESSPVIVTFAKTSSRIRQIPFPAITICPETKTLQEIYNFTQMYHKFYESNKNMTQEELKRFEQISLLCNNQPCENCSQTTSYEAIDFFSKVSPNFTDTMWLCTWLNQNETCETLFFPTLTDEGVCYTFNMLSKEDLFTDEVYSYEPYSFRNRTSTEWYIDTGYISTANANTFPRRALAAGKKGNFGVVLRLYEQHFDYSCKSGIQGFRIQMHNPGEVPSLTQQYFWAPIDTNLVTHIIPQVMTTSDGLKRYSSKVRGCYFSDERQLKFFKFYNQRNCELECLTNYTLRTCGCVSFSMPHNEFTNICGPGSSKCLEDSHNAVAERRFKMINDNLQKQIDKITQENCDCLPSCTSLSYDVEYSHTIFNWQQAFEAYKSNLTEFPGMRLTRVDFSFKMPQFFSSERNELFGITDFLSHCGGLFGIFIGFSLLSLFEILYFLTLRLVCNVKMYGLHLWSGSTVLVASNVKETDVY